MPILLRPLEQRSHLPTRLLDLGRSRKLARVAAGVFAFVAVALAAVTLACSLDSAVHLSAVPRAAFLLALLTGGAALSYRHIWQPLGEPVRARGVAHLLETTYPRLNDSLASAVEFLTGEEGTHTSARFRRVAVARAVRGLDKCDLNRLVPSGKAWRGFFLAAAVTAVAGGLGFAHPDHARHSLVRLFDPFGDHPWPTKTQIRVTSPAEADFPVRAAIGDPFDLAFSLTGVIPEAAVVAVQFEGGNRYEEVVPVETNELARDRAEVTVRLEPHRVPRSFRFQVRANDAATQWFDVTLAPPPKLVPFDGRQSPQMSLAFPAYTDLPPADLPDGVSVLETVHGTRVRFAAAADRRIARAVLVPQADRAALREATGVAVLAGTNPVSAAAAQTLADHTIADIPVTVSGPDGTRLTAEFTPRLSGVYTLRLTDETGLTGTRLLDFRITPDPPPLVVLERPAAGRDPVYLLPTSAVAVQARAEDRTFAVKRMVIEYRVGGPDAPPRELPLADLPAFGAPLSGLTGAAVGFTQSKQPSVSAATTFPVALFTKPDGSPPADGDRITLRAAAADYDDVSVLKEPGRSKEEFAIEIVSRPALETKLQEELSKKLRPKLLALREQQRQIRERTEEAARAAADGKLTPEEGVKLGQAERDQRGVRNEVTDPRDGLQRAAQSLKDTVEANGMPRTTTTERVAAIADDLARLGEQHLDPVEPLIATAKQEADKRATGGKPDQKKVADDLRKAVRQQQVAEANLDAMLKRLEQWAGAGEVRSEARAIKDQLTKSGEQGAKAAAQVESGKPVDKLTPTEKTELARAADKFNQLADRAGNTVGKAESLAEQKEAMAKERQAQADAKAAEAGAARAKAGEQPPGSDAAKSAMSNADALQAQADEAKAEAVKAKAEADALRAAVEKSGGHALEKDLRDAGAALQNNNPSQSAEAQQSAARRLDKLAGALAEQQPELGDQLKKKKELADEVDELADEQDELRKKVKAAEQLDDPMRREEEMKKLAREQERLREKTEQAAEKLTREREQDAADKLRAAAEKMEQAKAELEQGNAPGLQQQDALDRLDESVKQLDQQREDDKDKLSREKRQQLAEQVKALRDRLQATDDEAARIQADVVKQAGWDRAKAASLGDLEDRAKAIAEELRAVAEKELSPLPVYKQLSEQAATLTDTSAKRFAERKGDALDAIGQPFDEKAEQASDDRTRRPLRTAIRRIDHVLDSLKEDPKERQKQGEGGQGGGDMPPGGGAGSEPEQNSGVPPLAQLKALRAIQADLNDRTRAFAKDRPDKVQLTDADREELEEMEQAQREVADLFEKIKPAFEKAMEPKLP
jgi:hypothetical protein